MAKIRAFKGLRPKDELAGKVASRPYDVLSSAEARVEAEGNPYSFLHIVKSEIDLPEDVDIHSQAVYDKAKENFDQFVSEGIFIQDNEPCLYVYSQQMGNHVQYGLVAGSSVEDYENDIIKKHEHTRPVKELDRIKHMKTTRIHSGPVFLTYRPVNAVNQIINRQIQNSPDVDFVANDGVAHRLWVIRDSATVARLEELFKTEVPCTYIADGHHRAASSAKTALALKEANAHHTGNEEYNFFLSVLFPADQLSIIDYNRVAKDLNGLSEDEFLEALSAVFDIQEMGKNPCRPERLHRFGMFLNQTWYQLTARPGTYDDNDPIRCLDVTLLQELVLAPILGINDPRTDERIDFVGGIRGLNELEKRVLSGEMKVAFSLFPVSLEQLMSISDAGMVMPPKSTWFEPKLRSGIVVHAF